MFWTVTLSLLSGMGQLLKLFFLTLLFSLPLGLLIAFALRSRCKPVSWLFNVIVWIIRGTPLMLQLIIIFYGPGKWFDNNIWALFSDGRMAACVVAFVINYACYFAVIYKGGIEGVPVGQQEAGQVLGMTRGQTFFHVILPQMAKRVLLPVSNEVITLVKDTSLAFSISYVEMFTIAKQIAAAKTTMVPFVAAGIFYYIFNFVVAWVMELLEKKFSYYH